MEFVKSADVVVIGGGIVGTAILRELSKFDLQCVLVEKEPDVSLGTTKANSAILHAGFDAPTGSLKAITNVRGNRLYHQLERELDLDIKWTGSLVVATTDEEMATLQELMARGNANGVEGLQILSADEVLYFGNSEKDDGTPATAVGIKSFMVGSQIIVDENNPNRFKHYEFDEIIGIINENIK